MNKDTFESSDKYKMLELLTEKISTMEDKDKNYLSSMIHDINSIIKKTTNINDLVFKNYVLDLIKLDLTNRIEKNKYERKILSYMLNYVNAKIKNARK